MDSMEFFIAFMPILLMLIAWDGIWKMIAMWRAAQNKQLGWFIWIAILNTAGILPIIYLLLNKQKKED